MVLNDNMGAAELLRKLDRKEISASEFAHGVVEREEKNAHLNAVSHFDADLLIENAKRADDKRDRGRGGPMCGVPIVAKDNINTNSFPTTGGTAALLHHTPDRNAGVVDAIESAGAYIGGKAGMHELAFGITSNNACTGAVRNPHDPDKIPGGSSGGTASSVAAGIFPVGLGTDTGASVRLPAALCGITGFRPTVGRYAGDGIVPISHTRDTVGPIANNVEDIALLDSVLSGKKIPNQKSKIKDAVIGIPTALYENLESEVEAAVQTVIDAFKAEGAILKDIDFSEILTLNEQVGFPVALYEVMRDLPAYLAEHAPNITFEELVSKIASSDVAGVIGSQLGDEAMPEAAYRAAIDQHRPAMQAAYEEIFKSNGLTVLAFPTSPVRARNIGEDETIELNGTRVPTMGTFIRNTDFGSNLGVPSISLPCPEVKGLPIGIEFEGLAMGDESVIDFAFSVEELLTK